MNSLDFTFTEEKDNLTFHVDFRSVAERVEKANRFLKEQVLADCDQFIPFKTGALKQSAMIEEDGIAWHTPYAHYQYIGEKYVNPKTGKSGYVGKDGMWHGWKGQKIPSGEPLQYHTEGTGDHWFRRTKEAHYNEWLDGVSRIIRG